MKSYVRRKTTDRLITHKDVKEKTSTALLSGDVYLYFFGGTKVTPMKWESSGKTSFKCLNFYFKDYKLV